MKIFERNEESEIRTITEQILKKSPEPGEFNYCIPTSKNQKNYHRYAFRLVIACLVTAVIVTTGVLALTGNILFIPGLVSSKQKNTEITHSIENNIVIEQGNYEQKIMYGYIKGSTVYMKILFYEPANGMYGRPEYDIYYNGKLCAEGYKSYSNVSAELRFELPQVQKDEKMVIELYSDDKKIYDIEMLPILQTTEFFKERPMSTIGDVTLVTEATKEDNILDVYVSAVLPNPVEYYDIVNVGRERLNGFAESDVYLMDKSGNKITNLGNRFYEYPVETSSKYEKDATLMYYHHFRFDLDELSDNEYTLVIPSITYLDKETTLFGVKNKYIEVAGPFEMKIDL